MFPSCGRLATPVDWLLFITELVTFHEVGQWAFDNVVLCNVDQRVGKDVAVRRHCHYSTGNAAETTRYHLTAQNTASCQQKYIKSSYNA